MLVKDKTLQMELDTGAAVSITSEETHKKLFPDVPLHNSQIALKMYMGETMAVRGQLMVHVKCMDHRNAHSYLIVVDAHSKWPEVGEMVSTTTAATIRELRRMFAAYGLLEQLISNNGPQFSATEFAIFLRKNGVKHIRSAPYHPSPNGLAKQFVQPFKMIIKANQSHDVPIQHRLMNFLLTYCFTPHATTNECPWFLFLNR